MHNLNFNAAPHLVRNLAPAELVAHFINGSTDPDAARAIIKAAESTGCADADGALRAELAETRQNLDDAETDVSLLRDVAKAAAKAANHLAALLDPNRAAEPMGPGDRAHALNDLNALRAFLSIAEAANAIEGKP